MNTLQHALDLAAVGIACFPMTLAKTPLEGSHGVKDASIDPARLGELFAAPRAELVAVAAGLDRREIEQTLRSALSARGGQ